MPTEEVLPQVRLEQLSEENFNRVDARESRTRDRWNGEDIVRLLSCIFWNILQQHLEVRFWQREVLILNDFQILHHALVQRCLRIQHILALEID